MSAGPYDPSGGDANRGDTADAARAPMSVRRSARHSAWPGVAGAQTASKLALCAAPDAATEGAAVKNGAVRAPSARAAAIRRVIPEVPINPGPPHPPAGAAPPPAYTAHNARRLRARYGAKYPVTSKIT